MRAEPITVRDFSLLIHILPIDRSKKQYKSNRAKQAKGSDFFCLD